MLPVFSHSLSLCVLFPFLFPSWTLCNQCGSRVLTVWPLTLLFSLHQVFVVIQGALIVLTLPTSCMGMNRDVSRNVFALKIPEHTYALSFLFTSAQHVSTQLTVTPVLHPPSQRYEKLWSLLPYYTCFSQPDSSLGKSSNTAYLVGPGPYLSVTFSQAHFRISRHSLP